MTLNHNYLNGVQFMYQNTSILHVIQIIISISTSVAFFIFMLRP